MLEIKEESLFEEMRKKGSNIPDKIEYLQANGWESYKHHDNWVKSVWSDLEKYNSLLDLNEAFKQCVREQLILQKAIKTLANALKNDKGLYIAYQANIAMTFQDEFNLQFNLQSEKQESFIKWLMRGGLHTIANNASHNFLKILIS